MYQNLRNSKPNSDCLSETLLVEESSAEKSSAEKLPKKRENHLVDVIAHRIGETTDLRHMVRRKFDNLFDSIYHVNVQQSAFDGILFHPRPHCVLPN